MGSFRVGAALGAALLALVAGCSTTEPGTATAATGTPTTGKSSVPPKSPTSTSASSSAPPVSRPKTIDLRSTDACTVLKAIPKDVSGWTGRDPLETDSLEFRATKECVTSNSTTGQSIAITLVTNLGVAAYSDNGQRPGFSPTTVAGFPAYKLAQTSSPKRCFIDVDVADGQLLDVLWAFTVAGDPPPQSELCASATKAADAAMKVLGAS
jgi:hypothetical protein